MPHTRPVTPRSVTHNHDEDYSDEESDPNAKSDEDRFNHSSSDEKWINKMLKYWHKDQQNNYFCRWKTKGSKALDNQLRCF